MMKFKVIAGQHIQEDMSVEPNENGKRPSQCYGTGAPGGMTCESETDLVAKFGPEKFQLISGSPSERKAKNNPFPRGHIEEHSVAVAPAGQVGEGFQESTQTEDGRTISGPLGQGEGFGLVGKKGVGANQPSSESDEDEDDDEKEKPAQKGVPLHAPAKKNLVKTIIPANVEKMSLGELKKFADEEEIDYESNASKVDLIKAIRSAAK